MFVIPNIVWLCADVFMEKQRLESMCQRGLDEASALFATVLKNECKNGDGGWKNSLSTLHAKLEDEFMHSPAGVGVFRVSVAYLAAVAGLCVLSWIGFPASQLDYAEELETSTSARAEAVAAEILAGGGGLATVDRPVRSKAGRKPSAGVAKFMSASTTWALFNVASLSVAIMCIVLGYKYYSIPETISQQWEDAFINMHPASFRNFPQVRACTRSCCLLRILDD